MEREQAVAWLEAYRLAWERADARGVLELFASDARYRAHPLRPAHTGHDGVADYWARATADQRDVRVRLGDPVVDGHRVAAEWWTTMVAEGQPVTLAGAHYRSEPFRDPHLGREGVLAYTMRAYAAEAGQDPRFGTPFAGPAGAAVEWWATTLENGQPSTLIGTSVLGFAPDGLVVTARDYWILEPGHHRPPEGWGR